ncbi:MAG: hypothetical protein AVDCRST_MAG88-3812, partial [uncultured Thermomicrobiales bacterium]
CAGSWPWARFSRSVSPSLAPGRRAPRNRTTRGAVPIGTPRSRRSGRWRCPASTRMSGGIAASPTSAPGAAGATTRRGVPRRGCGSST